MDGVCCSREDGIVHGDGVSHKVDASRLDCRPVDCDVIGEDAQAASNGGLEDVEVTSVCDINVIADVVDAQVGDRRVERRDCRAFDVQRFGLDRTHHRVGGGQRDGAGRFDVHLSQADIAVDLDIGGICSDVELGGIEDSQINDIIRLGDVDFVGIDGHIVDIIRLVNVDFVGIDGHIVDIGGADFNVFSVCDRCIDDIVAAIIETHVGGVNISVSGVDHTDLNFTIRGPGSNRHVAFRGTKHQ